MKDTKVFLLIIKKVIKQKTLIISLLWSDLNNKKQKYKLFNLKDITNFLWFGKESSTCNAQPHKKMQV